MNLFPAREPGIIVAAASKTHNFPHRCGIGHRTMKRTSLFAAILLTCAAAAGHPACPGGFPSTAHGPGSPSS